MEDRIVISRERYEELIKLEDRVNIVVEWYSKKRYMDCATFLSILGTELALELVEEMEKKEKKALEDMLGDTE